MISQVQFIVNVIATALAAYTDWKTGYIFDWITYPLIGIGIILSVLTQAWMGLLLGVGIYALGYFAYKTGKMGGGDVKLLAGMAFVQPVFSGMIFVLGVLLVAAVSATIVLCTYYVGRLFLEKKKIDWKTKRKRTSLLLGGGLMLLLYALSSNPFLGSESFILLGISLVAGIIFYGLESEIKKYYFLKRIPIDEMEEDELLALEHLNEDEREKGMGDFSTLIGEKEKKVLKEKGFTTIPVYRNLPKFAPYLLIGVLAIYLFPEMWISIIPQVFA